jgi:TolB-like protein
MANIFTELKKRKVFNSASIYLATAFVVLSGAQIIIPALLIPQWVLSLLVVLAILGFPIVVVLSWIYDISDGGFVKTESEQTKTEVEAHHQGISKSSMLGIIASIIITIIMIYKGVELVTTSKQGGSKTSIAVLNFDNVRKFQEYDWLGDEIAGNLSYKLGGLSSIRIIDRFQILNKLGEVDPEKASILEYKVKQIANKIDVDLILHGQFTIFEMDSTIKVLAFLADTKTFDMLSLMNEKYPLNELSDIPNYINEKVSEYIKTNPRFKLAQ